MHKICFQHERSRASTTLSVELLYGTNDDVAFFFRDALLRDALALWRVKKGFPSICIGIFLEVDGGDKLFDASESRAVEALPS